MKDNLDGILVGWWWPGKAPNRSMRATKTHVRRENIPGRKSMGSELKKGAMAGVMGGRTDERQLICHLFL